MSNEEQAPRDPGHGPGGNEPDRPDGPDVVDPDGVVLDDGTLPPGALEPELSVSPDSLDLPEPALGPAEISRDTAEAASLEDAAAEARAVAAEAEKAGTLVGGPLPAGAPVVQAAPDGTAPAGGVAGDAAADADPAADPAADTADGAGVPAAGTGDDVPAGGPYAFPPEGGEQGLGHPGLYPGTDPASIGPAAPASPASPVDPSPGSRGATAAAWAPGAAGTDPEATDAEPKRDRSRARSSNLPLLLIIGGVVVLLGLLVWLLVSLFGGAEDEERVDPSSVAAGDCLADFTGITEDAVPVDCGEAHNAQLVASENYPEDAEFPGREQLGLRAEEACAAASAAIDPDAVTDDLRITLLRATPTSQTWADGDRRVDCFAVVEDGDTMSRSLLTS